MEKKVCLEHVELALDIIVDETGEYPVLEELPQEDRGTCEFCDEEAAYIVSSKK